MNNFNDTMQSIKKTNKELADLQPEGDFSGASEDSVWGGR